MGSALAADSRPPLLPAAPPVASCGTDGTFTPAAREVVSRAHIEAHSLGRDYVGTEHLVLALIADEGGAPGVRHVRRAPVVASIIRLTGPPGLISSGPPLMSPVLRRVLQAAAADARRAGDSDVRPEHLLNAVADERTCVGARVLADVGIEAAGLRHPVLPHA
jgi:ATP-dependent Clp protease ATP-binding subunit ClpC